MDHMCRCCTVILLLACTLCTPTLGITVTTTAKAEFEKSDTRSSRQIGFHECRSEPFNPSNKPLEVYLTVSSLITVTDSGRVLERQLELNWNNPLPQEGDWIGLFSQDPASTSTSSVLHTAPTLLERTNIGGRWNGVHRTDVSFPRPTLSARILRTECLGFWVAYIRHNRTLASDCLRSHPAWMWENRQALGTFRLRDLFIPGSHDSGSYQEYNRKYDNVISRYTICQDENIWNQLAYGIRYLDFRVGYYRTNPERFWLNHGEFKINPLRQALTDLASFMNSTNEVVIVDFHNFPWGMDTRDRHKELITIIHKELGEHMLPRSAGNDVILNDLWSVNKRLLVSYNDPAFLESDLLWPAIQQRWGDKNDANDLKIYLDNVMVMRHPSLWVAMAELTPTTGDIIKKPSGSLRILADQINHNVTGWFGSEWWDKSNIVATDFFHGNNLIEVAIEANLKRRVCWERVGRPVDNPRLPPGIRPQMPPQREPPTIIGPNPQNPSWNPGGSSNVPSANNNPWGMSINNINSINNNNLPGFPGSSWPQSSFPPNPNWTPSRPLLPNWGPARYPHPVPQPVVPGPPPYHHQQLQQEAQLNRMGMAHAFMPFTPHAKWARTPSWPGMYGGLYPPYPMPNGK